MSENMQEVAGTQWRVEACSFSDGGVAAASICGPYQHRPNW